MGTFSGKVLCFLSQVSGVAVESKRCCGFNITRYFTYLQQFYPCCLKILNRYIFRSGTKYFAQCILATQLSFMSFKSTKYAKIMTDANMACLTILDSRN